MAFGAYVLNAFGGVLGAVKLELITPFKYFSASEILTTGGFEGVSIGLMVGITLV
jgi:hypothetical protein